jgi:AAA domain
MINRSVMSSSRAVTEVLHVQTVLNSWHLCQFQRFNDAQYQRLCVLLKERKAAVSGGLINREGTVGGSSVGGYKRSRNGVPAAGEGRDSAAILAATKQEVSAAATSAAAAEELAMSVAAGTTKATLVPRPRILVCAPSNAATDELLKRVIDSKFVDVHGRPYSPRVVRIGSETAAMSESTKKVPVLFVYPHSTHLHTE